VIGTRERPVLALRPRYSWLAIWFIAPLVVSGSGDVGAYIFAGVLTPVALLAFWLIRA